MTKPHIKELALGLSARERLSLAIALWESINGEEELAGKGEREYVRQRVAAHRANPNATTSWDDAKLELRKKARRET
jgi:putative addiction module component (TIGR02574 family)